MDEPDTPHRLSLRRWKIACMCVVLVLVSVICFHARGYVIDLDWWRKNAVELAGQLITFVGIIVGALLLIHQLKRQHKSSLDVQRNGKRSDLNLRIYEALVDKAMAASATARSIRFYVYFIPGDLELALKAPVDQLPTPIIEKRAPELIKLHTEAENALSNLILEIEKWETSIERFDIFRLTLVSASYDVQRAFHSAFPLMVELLPTEIEPGSNRFFEKSVSLHSVEELRILAEKFTCAIDELQNFISDLVIDAQNELISDLFGRKLPMRSPADPILPVVTTRAEHYSALHRRFTIESAHGQSMQEALQAVRRFVNERDAK